MTSTLAIYSPFEIRVLAVCSRTACLPARLSEIAEKFFVFFFARPLSCARSQLLHGRHDGPRATTALRRSCRRRVQELRGHVRARRLADDRPVVYHVSNFSALRLFIV